MIAPAQSELKYKGVDYTGFDFLAVCGDKLSVRVLKRAYRKHVKNDDSIGRDELSDELFNVLAQIMGDDKFVEWNNSVHSLEGYVVTLPSGYMNAEVTESNCLTADTNDSTNWHQVSFDLPDGYWEIHKVDGNTVHLVAA